MAYNELIKSFSGIRNYMRQFLVYGFRKRDEFDAKSTRSYDNEKRRVESWLSDYMSFRQDANGKSVFLSMDSRYIPYNPLHKAWKASGFTKNDISLHFLLLDILSGGVSLGIPEILDCIDSEYLQTFQNPEPINESTLRKKLKEYVELGLVVSEKRGKQLIYSLAETGVDLDAWQNAVTFFSEENSLGVIGSFLSDKYEELQSFFSYKHRYLLFSLDSDIMLGLLTAIHEHRKVELELNGGKNSKTRRCTVLPLNIYISVQGGRQYLAAYNQWKSKACFFRMDSIQRVKSLEIVEGYNTYHGHFKNEQPRIWGVSIGQGKLEHVEMTLIVAPSDIHIAYRLEREKRCGMVVRLDETTWKFAADVYDAGELLPWIRTFIGRIASLTCSNKKVEEQFWQDLAVISAQYGGDSDDV